MHDYWRERYRMLAKQDIPDWQKANWWYEYIIYSQLEFLENSFRNLPENKKICIADVGCGPGTFALHFSQKGHTVLGFDLTFDYLAQIKKKDQPDNLLLINADATLLPIRKGALDAAIYFGVMQTTEKPELHFKQLSEALKPGGILVMTTLRRHSIWELPFWPVYMLSLQDYFPNVKCRSSEIINKRHYLLPRSSDEQGCLLKRYDQEEIVCWLIKTGFYKISFTYDGPIKRMPHLSNSIMTYVKAIKR
jgi:SAM-dependent methyltransferase